MPGGYPLLSYLILQIQKTLLANQAYSSLSLAQSFCRAIIGPTKLLSVDLLFQYAEMLNTFAMSAT
jgi:hypothetical protein